MKEIWVLSVKTSLPKGYLDPRDLKTNITAFESFEEAREALRNALKKYAFSKNRLFDGKGNIIWLNQEIKSLQEYEKEYKTNDEYEDELTSSKLTSVKTHLQCVFNGENIVPKRFKWDNGLLVCTFSNDKLEIYGDDDGECPTLKTNILSMEDEKDYYLYLAEDYMYNDDAPAVLMIDLKKCMFG